MIHRRRTPRPWSGTAIKLTLGVGMALAGCDRRADDHPSERPTAKARPGPAPVESPAGSAKRSLDRSPTGRDNGRDDLVYERLGPVADGPLAVVRDTLAAPDDEESSPDRRPPRAMKQPRELWRTRIGLTTYRSTIHHREALVIVNSNGASRKSSRDREDVVWLLDATTGKEAGRLTPTGGGERDCNGVALDDQIVVFGTDQDVLYGFDWAGQVRWRTKLDGDVEAAPALADLNGDSTADAVVGTEAGTVFAVSGLDGRVMWKAASDRGEYGQTGFLASPAAVDVTGDGLPEVFIAGRDGVMRCFDGRTGRERWQIRGATGMHASPLVLDVDGDERFEVAFSESYGTMYLADADSGRVRWRSKLAIGLMGPMGWYPDGGCFVAGTAWFGENEKVYCVATDSGQLRWTWTVPREKISSGFVVGDVDGTEGHELVFGTESGALVALGPDGQLRWRVDLEAPIECTPTLTDLDGDDHLDVLVAANDGYLRALTTSGYPPAFLGYFRGDAENSGAP